MLAPLRSALLSSAFPATKSFPNTFTSKIPGDNAGPIKGHTAGFSDLDQLLAQKGPLGSGTKLRLPDDQLFQYDSDVLQASAIGQLQKLGTLIQRNPKATFSVEGYTDSFGNQVTYTYDAAGQLTAISMPGSRRSPAATRAARA